MAYPLPLPHWQRQRASVSLVSLERSPAPGLAAGSEEAREAEADELAAEEYEDIETSGAAGTEGDAEEAAEGDASPESEDVPADSSEEPAE